MRTTDQLNSLCANRLRRLKVPGTEKRQAPKKGTEKRHFGYMP
jgi:hypothetical protein